MKSNLGIVTTMWPLLESFSIRFTVTALVAVSHAYFYPAYMRPLTPRQIQDAADQGIVFSGFIQEPAGLHPRVTSRGGLGEASLSLHSSPSSLRCSELTASPSHQGESGSEDWAADGDTEEPRTSRDTGVGFVNMVNHILSVLRLWAVLDRCNYNKPILSSYCCSRWRCSLRRDVHCFQIRGL